MLLQLMKEFPLLGMLNIHENLLEALLELQAYADVQAVLAKYDGKIKTNIWSFRQQYLMILLKLLVEIHDLCFPPS